MDHKTNVWDMIAAMAGGAICTTWLGQTPTLKILDFHIWQYSTDALIFALKAAAGGLIAIFFKKAGEDIYNETKAFLKILFKRKTK